MLTGSPSKGAGAWSLSTVTMSSRPAPASSKDQSSGATLVVVTSFLALAVRTIRAAVSMKPSSLPRARGGYIGTGTTPTETAPRNVRTKSSLSGMIMARRSPFLRPIRWRWRPRLWASATRALNG